MSETTTSAPAAPAAPAPSSDSGPYLGPPAATQNPLSVSDAARLLNQQRRKEGEPASPAAPDRRPSGNELAQAAQQKQAAQKPGDSAQSATVPAGRQPAETGLSAMDKALGVPGDAAPVANVSDNSAGIEIEGQRYSQAQLRDAVMKAADYTKKTQEVAAQQRQLQAQAEALAKVLPFIQPELARLQQVVQGVPRPDPALLESDPQRYLRERAQWEQALDEQQRLGGLTEIQRQAQERAMEQAVAQGNEQLAREFPFWADPKERLAAQQAIVDWATNKGGFSRDELRGLTDARHLKLMMKARAFDQWVDGARTAAPVSVVAATPARGVAPPPAPAQRVQEASDAFDQRPNVRNAAMLLSARRSNGSVQR